MKNADWMKEFSKTGSSIIFQLDPTVKFDENVAAVIEFTSPSDPTFYATASVKPAMGCNKKSERHQYMIQSFHRFRIIM